MRGCLADAQTRGHLQTVLQELRLPGLVVAGLDADGMAHENPDVDGLRGLLRPGLEEFSEAVDAEVVSADGDCVYLDPGTPGECRRLDRGPGWERGREVLRVLVIHLGEF